MMEEPNLTQSLIANALFLFFTRKLNDWFMWPFKVLSILFVSLFFVKYVPIVFNWLFT